MHSNEEVIIKVSRSKILFILLLCLMMVAVGLYLISANEGTPRISLFSLHMMGWASLVFFGFVSIFIVIEILFGTMSGLTFSSTGITDNSSIVSVGFIPWNEITSYHINSFQINEKYNLELLVVLIKDPEGYKKTGNFIKRFYKRENDKTYGSPIVISPRIYKIGIKELLKITDDFYKKYGCHASNPPFKRD